MVDGSTFEVGDIRIRVGELRQGLGGAQLARGVAVEVECKNRGAEEAHGSGQEDVIKAFWGELGIKGAREYMTTASETGDEFDDVRTWCRALMLRG